MLNSIRRRLEEDPEAVAEYVMQAIKNGKDVRALTAMLDRIYDAEQARVEMPHTFDELEKLSAEERRTLLTQLEQERGAEPFSADRWRAAVEADRARMLEELKKLSPADRQLIVDALNDLKA